MELLILLIVAGVAGFLSEDPAVRKATRLPVSKS
jgi:hypothetical protein